MTARTVYVDDAVPPLSEVVGAVGDVRDHRPAPVDVVRDVRRVRGVVLEAEHAPADVDAARHGHGDDAAVETLQVIEAVAAGVVAGARRRPPNRRAGGPVSRPPAPPAVPPPLPAVPPRRLCRRAAGAGRARRARRPPRRPTAAARPGGDGAARSGRPRGRVSPARARRAGVAGRRPPRRSIHRCRPRPRRSTPPLPTVLPTSPGTQLASKQAAEYGQRPDRGRALEQTEGHEGGLRGFSPYMWPRRPIHQRKCEPVCDGAVCRGGPGTPRCVRLGRYQTMYCPLRISSAVRSRMPE